jgi:hypothetical protein
MGHVVVADRAMADAERGDVVLQVLLARLRGAAIEAFVVAMTLSIRDVDVKAELWQAHCVDSLLCGNQYAGSIEVAGFCQRRVAGCSGPLVLRVENFWRRGSDSKPGTVLQSAFECELPGWNGSLALLRSGWRNDTSPQNGCCTAAGRLLCVNLLKAEQLS